LPFRTSPRGKVERIADAKASGGGLHKLHVTTIGETGDYVAYTVRVPKTGDYYVGVRYLQDAGGFRYLGYSRLSVDGVSVGPYWDQSGLTRAVLDMPLGKTRLTAGEHTFRFDSVWRSRRRYPRNRLQPPCRLETVCGTPSIPARGRASRTSPS
jgi:hypothetical protein